MVVTLWNLPRGTSGGVMESSSALQQNLLQEQHLA